MVSPERVKLQLEQLTDSVREQNRLVLLDLEPSEQEREDLNLLLSTVKSGVERLPLDRSASLIEEFTELADQLEELGIDPALYTLEIAPAQPVARQPAPSSLRAHEDDGTASINSMKKSVRFSDVTEEFGPVPYTDHPEAPPAPVQPAPGSGGEPVPYQSEVEIFAENNLLLSDQDRRLDSLSASVRRQRDLGIEIDGEVTSQLGMLDDLEAQTDRSSSRLGTARERVETFNRKTRESGSCMVITCLVLILFILLVVL